MLIQLVFVSLKTFKNLRIYDQFSPLVQMLKRVIIDLRFFLFMFFINIMFFTLVLSVLRNKESKSYKYLPHILGNFFDSLRCSIGNFEVIKRVKNDRESSVLFWLCWTVIVVVQVMVFMNFIIADTTASYVKITKRLAEIIQQDKCAMISEAEQLLPSFIQN